MTRRVIQLIAICSMVLAAVSVQAAGFGIYEFSARANALGNSVMAGKADPSSIALNPAQLTQLDGTQIAIGASGIYPQATVDIESPASDAGSYDGKSTLWTMPHLYVTHAVNDQIYVGMGVFSRFGLGTEFDKNWPGASDVYKVGIKTVSINPLIGYKVTDNFAIAIGPEIMWFDFELKKKTGHPLNHVYLDTEMGGDSWGAGLALGMRYQWTDWLSLGASYRSEVTQNVEGKIKMTYGGVTKKDTDASGKITLPQQIGFGINLKPMDKLSVEVGATWIGWSSYEELKVDFAGGPYTKSSQYKDTWRYNIGAEYNLTENWDLRASYVYDESPLNSSHLSYMVPANDRQIVGVGLGWHNEHWTVDASYNYLFISDRSGHVTVKDSSADPYIQDAKFKDGDAHIVGLTVGYKF
ncbi:OmpP1/FadL family transporter [Halodesulfovibrio marinisediminis]|uniref:Long-chain fatty acid transport protein n=1 Tax=Halodesulfovibrio marinisediminis DSM 17456 TaxID=1121457 RepID=A0A1N6F2V5_9BACT|nr:OmpP1/FadL family transporter [Halodesulfovibrio marinisediminis]SIN89554.1 long-chain fatty acid transport protein [Halodesulfovibrio marinisediminis DSM 17456]